MRGHRWTLVSYYQPLTRVRNVLYRNQCPAASSVHGLLQASFAKPHFSAYNRAVMAGSPIKHERNRLVREAILRGMADGSDPVDYLTPYTDKLRELALAGDMAAMREMFDRLDGKPKQQIEATGADDGPLRIIHESK